MFSENAGEGKNLTTLKLSKTSTAGEEKQDTQKMPQTGIGDAVLAGSHRSLRGIFKSLDFILNAVWTHGQLLSTRMVA